MAEGMPETRYARSGDVNLAYQVMGEGPPDLVIVQGYISHLELAWESPMHAHMMNRLASFSRVINFDKRGVGMSDAVDDLPGLEQRMDDVRAVMDAAGSERAVLFGNSEGGMMCILFAATYPERVESLVLYGSMPRSTWAPDFPWANTREGLLESSALISEHWGEGAVIEAFAPSTADMPGVREAAARFERYAASPRAIGKLFEMFLDMDVRDVLPSIRVPTLVIHRRGDRVVNVRAARWLAEQIPGARYVEKEGIDHLLRAGNLDEIMDEVEEFVTGTRGASVPDRMLATIMFTDIVSSTERAAAAGDKEWRELLAMHEQEVRTQLARFHGREIKTIGDGFLAIFDGPARAIQCGVAISEACAAVGMNVRVGLHTGECEKLGDDVGGMAVNIAARVGALAETDEVLVTRTVKDLVVGSGFTFEQRGTHVLKGVPDDWQLYAVTGA